MTHYQQKQTDFLLFKKKVINTACEQIKNAKSRKAANAIYLNWKEIHNEPDFKVAIQEKKKEFQKI